MPADAEARVTSGALEQSNVRPTEVLVEMVEAQRSFDMRTKLISTARELDEGGANSGERLRCVVSPYDVEEHVEAREELRYKLRKADPATRRIVYMELDL